MAGNPLSAYADEPWNPLSSAGPAPAITAATAPTPADAATYNAQAAQAWLRHQQAISAAMGLADPVTGLPTKAGIVNAAGQVANGVMMGTTAPGEVGPGIVAYHGSPHDFDAFDLSKIGTGEGAQAYGHGLYFAEHEPVAQQYRDQMRWKGADFNDPQIIAQNAIDRNGDRLAAADSLQNALDSTLRFYRGKVPASQVEANKNTAQAIALLRGSGEITGQPPTQGRMYEVNLNVAPHQLLDYDAPLGNQSDYVKNAIGLQGVARPSIDETAAVMKAARDAGIPFKDYPAYRELQARLAASKEASFTGIGLPPPKGATSLAVGSPADLRGSEYLGALTEQHGPVGAAERLRIAGIPGIQYLDQGSRAAGTGSRNYVMFDPKLISIARKYAIPLTALSGSMPGLFADQDAPSQ